jgi:para-nitrobenzyl esterase
LLRTVGLVRVQRLQRAVHAAVISKENTMSIRYSAGVLATATLSLLAAAAFAAPPAGSAPVVQTRYGEIRGYNDGTVKVFKGVPYGASTAGANRWLPAQPPAPWKGIRDATRPGAISPQLFGAPMPEETAMLQRGPMTEDMLTLNIYTPAVGRHAGSHPVMVWFHGGGFTGGGGSATSYNGHNLAAKDGIVFVTVTHRLNVFGFLYLADLFGPAYADSGNVGILDAVAALRWVRENIERFGGDPDNVTILGQSGGGAKVTTLMAMPAAKGLFRQAIAESGAAIRALPKAQAAANAKRLIDALGVSTAAQLLAVPQEKLEDTWNSLHLPSGPVVDGRTLYFNPFDPVAPEISRHVPLMVGTTETEAVFMPSTPVDPIDDATLRDDVKNFLHASDADTDQMIQTFRKAYPGKDNAYLFQLLSSQASFQEGSTTLAERKADQGGAPVYMYYFTYHLSVRDGKLHAPHTAEIPFALDSLASSGPIVGPVTPEKQALADQVSSAWVNFARTGDPNNPKIPTWPAFDTHQRAVMIIDEPWHAVNDPLHDTRLAILQFRAHNPTGGALGVPAPAPAAPAR